MDNGKSDIDVEKIVKHWVETSDDDFTTMLALYKSNSYGWSLFLGHISIEKLLKALYLKRFEKHAPFTHNLYTSDYAKSWIDRIKIIRSWIKEML